MRISVVFSTALLLGLFCQVAVAEINRSSLQVKWGYQGNIGPARWAELSDQFALCARGREQSPINIQGKMTVVPYSLGLKYHRASLNIMRDGATDLTIGKQQTLVNTGHGLQVDFHSQDREMVYYHKQAYHLVQFHFHSPSETQISGNGFPLEIHFVNQGSHGQVLVIAVFVKGGEVNPVIDKILANLPAKDGKEHSILKENINPADLLQDVHRYYSFPGSLTTPPCTEKLQWVVVEQPITASPAQIVALRQAMGGANARPVQPLAHRVIGFSEQGALARAATWLGFGSVEFDGSL